jgi:hypothetical protein
MLILTRLAVYHAHSRQKKVHSREKKVHSREKKVCARQKKVCARQKNYSKENKNSSKENKNYSKENKKAQQGEREAIHRINAKHSDTHPQSYTAKPPLGGTVLRSYNWRGDIAQYTSHLHDDDLDSCVIPGSKISCVITGSTIYSELFLPSGKLVATLARDELFYGVTIGPILQTTEDTVVTGCQLQGIYYTMKISAILGAAYEPLRTKWEKMKRDEYDISNALGKRGIGLGLHRVNMVYYSAKGWLVSYMILDSYTTNFGDIMNASAIDAGNNVGDYSLLGWVVEQETKWRRRGKDLLERIKGLVDAGYVHIDLSPAAVVFAIDRTGPIGNERLVLRDFQLNDMRNFLSSTDTNTGTPSYLTCMQILYMLIQIIYKQPLYLAIVFFQKWLGPILQAEFNRSPFREAPEFSISLIEYCLDVKYSTVVTFLHQSEQRHTELQLRTWLKADIASLLYPDGLPTKLTTWLEESM